MPAKFNLTYYRSGTEEEYTELLQLLEDIATYQHDMQVAPLKEKEAKKLKETSDRKKGVEMRKAAMETYSRKLLLLFMTIIAIIMIERNRLEREKENRFFEKDNDFDFICDGDADKGKLACYYSKYF